MGISELPPNKYVKDLESVLKQEYKYLATFYDHEYESSEGKTGQIDLLILDGLRNALFLEFKSKHSPSLYIKANNQFDKFENTYPHLNSIGLYVTPELILPLNPEKFDRKTWEITDYIESRFIEPMNGTRIYN